MGCHNVEFNGTIQKLALILIMYSFYVNHCYAYVNVLHNQILAKIYSTAKETLKFVTLKLIKNKNMLNSRNKYYM